MPGRTRREAVRPEGHRTAGMGEAVTRAAQAEVLQMLGVDAGVAETTLRLLAPKRHEWRVGTVLEEARKYVSPEAASYFCSRSAVWLMCQLDAYGVGGQMGLTGEGTDRHPAFVRCGKGRKHASDGDAWSAAITAAQTNVAGDERLSVIASEDGLRVIVGELTRSGEFLPHDEFIVGEKIVPLRWARTLGYRALLHALEAGDNDAATNWGKLLQLVEERLTAPSPSSLEEVTGSWEEVLTQEGMS